MLSANSVLVLSGLDPSGAAGIAADIETINQLNAIPLPIITALTVQNTSSVKSINAVDSKIITQQLNHLKNDINFTTAKIGLLPTTQQIEALELFFNNNKNITIVLDPIIRSSSDNELVNKNTITLLKQKILPITTLITPNVAELLALTNCEDEVRAVKLLPCKWLLLTTTDTSDKIIQHRLYRHAKLVDSFKYTKLKHNYHGSGCTLSSAISALLAQGLEVRSACKKALDYTYQSILSAKKIGKMQYHPHRGSTK